MPNHYLNLDTFGPKYVDPKYIPTQLPVTAPLASDKFEQFKRVVQDAYARNRWSSNFTGDMGSYGKEIQQLQKSFPNEFARLQEENTTAREKILNQIAFDMDKYGDPESIKALKDFETRSNVPYGYEKRLYQVPIQGTASGLYHFPTDTADFYGVNVRDPEELKRTIRHEAQHRRPKGLEKDVLLMDAAYAISDNNIDRFDFLNQRLRQEGISTDKFDWEGFMKHNNIPLPNESKD